MRYTVGSLFAGIGGIELGLERAGLGPVLWQVERDLFCNTVLARHWPDVERFDDVRKVGASVLHPVDVICGGFPCQDVSSAGKGAGLDGARSGLWREYARIVGELRPRVVIVENVASGKGRWLCEVRTDLQALGYDSTAYAISAADVGAPHRRNRIFVVAHANQGGLASVGRGGQLDAGERAQQRDDVDGRGGTRGLEIDGRATAESRLGRDADGLPGRLDDGTAVRSLRWPAGQGEWQRDWEPARAVVRRAFASQRLTALGNAVVPQCAEVVGRIALELLRGAP